MEGDRSLRVGAASCGPIAYGGLQGFGDGYVAAWWACPFRQPLAAVPSLIEPAHAKLHGGGELWAHMDSSRCSRLVAAQNNEAALKPVASAAGGEQRREVDWKVQPQH